MASGRSKEPSTRTNQFRFYALAASLIPATIPYTFIFVRPTISALQGRAAHFNAMQKSSTSTTLSKATESGSGMWHETSAADTGPSGAPSNARSTFSEFVNTAMSRSGPSINEMTVHQLVDRWGWLNLGTAAIPLAGALCALWAIVNQELSVFAYVPTFATLTSFRLGAGEQSFHSWLLSITILHCAETC